MKTLLTTTSRELDLTDAAQTRQWFDQNRPDVVIDAAARVGGIHANNSEPVEFLLQNLRIQNNVIQFAMEAGAEKLLFLGSSCIYPKHAEQPLREEALLTGPLEPTNEAYAIAKIAGIKLCQAYRRQYGRACVSAMPTNLYGPYDNFDLESSPRLAGPAQKVSRSERARRAERADLGVGQAAARVPARRRSGGCLDFPSRERHRPGPRQRRLRGKKSVSATWRV